MQKRAWLYLFSILLIIVILGWLAVLQKPSANMRVIACNVGQGDAILITKGETQVLVDGGPGSKVISCLSRHMPFWDRTLEMVVLTHPDADHSTGLVEVFRDYRISQFVTSEINRDTKVYTTLKDLVASKGTKVNLVAKSDRLVIGDIHFDVLNPSLAMISKVPGYRENVLGSATSDKANDYSVVLKLSFGEFDALLTGDIEDAISDSLADSFDLTGIEYLKVPHHGSKNGLSQKLFDEVKPQISIISLGKNSFGHPHEEVLDILINSQTKILRTDFIGDVVIESDGARWWVRN